MQNDTRRAERDPLTNCKNYDPAKDINLIVKSSRLPDGGFAVGRRAGCRKSKLYRQYIAILLKYIVEVTTW